MPESREKPNSNIPDNIKRKIEEIERELNREGLEGIIKGSRGSTFEEELKKLTAPDADEKINEELNEMGSFERVLEESEIENMNREIDNFEVLVDKSKERKRKRAIIKIMIEQINKKLDSGEIKRDTLIRDVKFQNINLEFHLREFILKGILDQDMTAMEVLIALHHYLIRLDIEERAENR